MMCWQCFVNSQGQLLVEAQFVFEGKSWCLAHFVMHYGSIAPKRARPESTQEKTE